MSITSIPEEITDEEFDTILDFDYNQIRQAFPLVDLSRLGIFQRGDRVYTDGVNEFDFDGRVVVGPIARDDMTDVELRGWRVT